MFKYSYRFNIILEGFSILCQLGRNAELPLFRQVVKILWIRKFDSGIGSWKIDVVCLYTRIIDSKFRRLSSTPGTGLSSGVRQGSPRTPGLTVASIGNVFLALAHRPAEFRAFFAAHDALMDKSEGLSKAEREMIVVATSAVNNCLYCVVAHGAILRIRAKNPLKAKP